MRSQVNPKTITSPCTGIGNSVTAVLPNPAYLTGCDLTLVATRSGDVGGETIHER